MKDNTTMTKLISSLPNLTLPSASFSDPEPARRLIILIPDVEFDPAPVLQRIWELANAAGPRIQFLGLCKDAAQKSSLQRRLIAMSALMQDGRISAEAKVEIGTNWIEAVGRNYQTGDMIVCFAEQYSGLLHRPVNQILSAKFDAPIYVLSNLYPRRSKSNWTTQIAAWSGSLGIIIGFGILQIKIVQFPKDWLQSAKLILSIIPEFWLMWAWNSLFK